MSLSAFLSAADEQRSQRTLRRLAAHSTSAFVLTGGFAVELHLLQRGHAAQIRSLNDIDFLVDSFSQIPPSLSPEFLFRHVHPHDSPGKTLLQAVDSDTSIRIDIFRAYGAVTARASAIDLAGVPLRLISFEDLLARTARLCLDLVAGTPIPAKHAADFLRVLPFANLHAVESVWPEHRKPAHPTTFAEAAKIVSQLIPSRKDLHILVDYSQDANQTCLRCEATNELPLASAERVLSLLKYC